MPTICTYHNRTELPCHHLSVASQSEHVVDHNHRSYSRYEYVFHLGAAHKADRYSRSWEREVALLLLGRQSSTADFDRREAERNQGAQLFDELVSSPGQRFHKVRRLVRWAVREEERRVRSRRNLREWDGSRPVVYWKGHQWHLYTPPPPNPEEQ